ncbi:MAG TPA: ATP-binding protein [Casimicrobiaceae bacterium]|nr:ATP-binding protein [Casimicrobiaceae bacterium]
MSVPDEATFAAALDQLPATAAFVEAFCRRRTIDAGDVLRLTLIVEEVFSNVVRHGYRGGSGWVRIALVADGRDVLLGFEDAAPPSDPRTALARMPADLGDPVETRAVGGLGAWLVGRLVVDASYVRQSDANVLSLRFRCGVTSAR